MSGQFRLAELRAAAERYYVVGAVPPRGVGAGVVTPDAVLALVEAVERTIKVLTGEGTEGDAEMALANFLVESSIDA